jgi:hypothetical protein
MTDLFPGILKSVLIITVKLPGSAGCRKGKLISGKAEPLILLVWIMAR